MRFSEIKIAIKYLHGFGIRTNNKLNQISKRFREKKVERRFKKWKILKN